MTLKDKILREFLQHPEQTLSGQTLSEQYQVSRTAIWKAIQSLKKEGYVIESNPNKGYQLIEDIDQLDSTHLQMYLKDVPLYVFEEIDSTNNFAKKIAIDGAKNGTLIVANHQSAGRGRQGHSFYSPADTGLYMTILLRPKGSLAELLQITLAAGVATCHAIHEVCGIDCQIKWVNDLFIGKKKICGILTEATTDFESQQIDSILVGIGINCKPSNFPKEIQDIAGSLNQEKINRNQLAASIYKHFMIWKDNLHTDELLKEYKKLSLLLGKQVIYEMNHVKKQGLAYDINKQGNLVIRDEHGKQIIVQSGEVSVKDWD